MIGNRNYTKNRGRRTGNLRNYKDPAAFVDQISPHTNEEIGSKEPSIPTVKGSELEAEATFQGDEFALQSLWTGIESVAKQCEYSSDLAPPQFSAKFMFDDDEGFTLIDKVSKKPDQLPRLMTGNLNRSDFTGNRQYEEQNENWLDQWQQPSIRSAPQPLKKSASMASLSAGLMDDPPALLFHTSNMPRSRSITQPFNFFDNSRPDFRSNVEYNRSAFHYDPAPRSAPIQPTQPTISRKTVTISHPSAKLPLRNSNSSQPSSPKLLAQVNINPGVCRYFLKGHCSRGDRCHFIHSSVSASTSPVIKPLPVPTHSRTLTSPEAETMFPRSRTLTSPVYPKFGDNECIVDNLPNPNHALIPTSSLFDNYTPHNKSKQPAKHIAMDSKLVLKGPRREDEASKFVNVNFKEFVGQFYALSKDQFGCRFLQKQIETHPEVVNLIFFEIFPNFMELMVDPFGNYLCQKLIEHCTFYEIGMIIDLVCPEVCSIALNMHGTRSIQTLIENTTDMTQIKLLVDNLNRDALKLIKDLNGNHVVQKCLAKLPEHHNQFIYDAISRHCVSIATHRHGCCVLQRCLDHAVQRQRIQLVNVVSENALELVQDPFGNYVVQYILDLDDFVCSSLVIRPFIGNICLLSTQKFSSNVIEKCIRVSSPDLRFQLIEELIDPLKLETLLRDSYANYVVQTALTYAEPNQKAMLIECIRPIMPSIKSTPYGKRLQTRLE